MSWANKKIVGLVDLNFTSPGLVRCFSDPVSYIGTEDEMPSVQCNILNVPADTLLYYKRSVGIPFIGNLLQQLQNHFSADNCQPVSALLSLIPYLIVQTRVAFPRAI